jgi:hypothetical protein
MRVEVCNTLDIQTEAISDRYLGLPTMVGMDMSDCFKYLVEIVLKIIGGWKEKILSMGGKELLLKAVAHVIPTFVMSMFKIMKNICNGITDAISGVMMPITRKCTGSLGGNHTFQRTGGGSSDLKTLIVSTWLC